VYSSISKRSIPPSGPFSLVLLLMRSGNRAKLSVCLWRSSQQCPLFPPLRAILHRNLHSQEILKPVLTLRLSCTAAFPDPCLFSSENYLFISALKTGSFCPSLLFPSRPNTKYIVLPIPVVKVMGLFAFTRSVCPLSDSLLPSHCFSFFLVVCS